MTESSTRQIEVRLSGTAGTAALLKLLTVLHIRTRSVIELRFDLHDPQGPLLKGWVSLHRESSAELLERQLARPVDVVETRVERRGQLWDWPVPPAADDGFGRADDAPAAVVRQGRQPTDRTRGERHVTLDQQHWNDRLAALAEKHGVVGASLAVRHGEQATEAAAGVLNVRTQQPATPDSVFQIGSITKVWTATLVMQLVDEDLLDLDEPVVKHLPEFRVADPQVTRTVTARQLLAHTSGIDGDLFVDTGRGDDSVEKYVAAMAELTQVHPQGATMSYCNSGFTLLGRLVEVLRGQSWDAVLRERLFVPLGLVSAGTLPEEALLWGAAAGHVVPNGSTEPQVVPQWGIYRSTGPAGLIHATARDVLSFAQLHLARGLSSGGTRVLSETSCAAMLEPQVEVPDRYTLGSHWGLGWILMEWDGRRVFGHDGGTLGQGAFLRILSEADLSVCLETNGGLHPRELFEDLFGEIFSALAGVELPRRLEPTPGATVDAARFIGRYAREGVEMSITEQDGELRLLARPIGALFEGLPDPEPMRLLPYEGDVLLAKGPQDEVWSAAVFFDLDGERYVHHGARATRRISTEV